MPYIGPLQIIITHSAVPTNIQAAANVSFDDNDGEVLSAYISGPTQIQIVRRVAVFGTPFTPTPDPPPSPIPDIPAAADPPFPPVWPYLFSSDQIYGRDGVGVIQRMVRQDTYAMACTAIYLDNGNALDLTGGTLTMTARFEQNSSAAIFALTSTAGDIVITDAAAGEFTVTIPSVATATVPLITTTLFFDVQWKTSSVTYTVLRGQLVILPDITTS